MGTLHPLGMLDPTPPYNVVFKANLRCFEVSSSFILLTLCGGGKGMKMGREGIGKLVSMAFSYVFAYVDVNRLLNNCISANITAGYRTQIKF